MKKNEYRPVPGYEGLYEITAEGHIRNTQTQQNLKPRRHNQYLRVRLYKDQLGREKFVHALVRSAFPENFPEPQPIKKRIINRVHQLKLRGLNVGEIANETRLTHSEVETCLSLPFTTRVDTTYLQEEWRPIYGTQKAYLVSNFGRVKHEDGVFIDPDERGVVRYKPPHGKSQYRPVNAIMSDNFEKDYRPKFGRKISHITKNKIDRAGSLYRNGTPIGQIARLLKVSYQVASILIINYNCNS